MQLTAHFTDEDLGLGEIADVGLLAGATYICEKLLEPIRARFGPVHVHDAYRSPAHNFEVGGKEASYHLFLAGESAADIDALPAVSIPDLFDWIRLESGLPFDKVILEYDANGQPGCVHLQIDSSNPPRRLAFVGETGAGDRYTPAVVR